ncbi:MAG: autotransporter outer membrane beta-barrel domain-containing protein [Pseudomonadota bacterium]
MRDRLPKTNARPASTQNPPQPAYLNIMVRGGRMTKLAGVAASFAPSLGTIGTALMTGASAIALGSALSVTGAQAGSCVAGGGTYTCSGPADALADVTQTLTPVGPLNVVTEPGFGIDTSVSGGNAFNLGSANTTSIYFDDTNISPITGAVDGIYVNNALGASYAYLDTSGTITGVAGRGVNMFNFGGGSTVIRNENIAGTASVTGYLDGIYAYTDTTTTALIISTNNVTAINDQGIDARHFGTGATTITATNAAGTALVDGFSGGIVAFNLGFGTGSITVAANNVNADNGTAIDAYNVSGPGITITTDGTVTGTNGYGIQTRNNGTGATTITTTNAAGDTFVTGDAGGIRAYAAPLTTSSMTITTNNVSSSMGSGIYARNEGTGGLTVTATNDAGTALVSGDDYGIEARNYNGGALTITANRVSANTAVGVYGYNEVLGTSLVITVDDQVSSGNSTGVAGFNRGSGSNVINVSNAEGNAIVLAGGTGIYGYNRSSATSLSIVGNMVYGYGGNGIRARNYGSLGTDVTVTNSVGTGQVFGDDIGIDARNQYESLFIVADNVTGANQDGIRAYNSNTGDVLSITVFGDVTGGNDGIQAANYGIGSTSIIASNIDGTSTVTGANNGINAYSDSSTTTLNVAANTVTGTNANGIIANHRGTGGLRVSALNGDGTATATGDTNGIFAYNTNGGALTVLANNARGINGYGIYAYSDGVAGLNVTTTGAVSGGLDGIYARSRGTGAITITSVNPDGDASVTGFVNGIRTYADLPSSYTTIQANNVTGTTGSGINVVHYGIAGVTVESTNDAGTAAALGNIDGIRVVNYFGGAVEITANNVVGSNDNGIEVDTDIAGTDITVTVSGDVLGGDTGIDIDNEGTGSAIVEASGETSFVRGLADTGIFVDNDNTTTYVSITSLGTTQGADYGIQVDSSGSGGVTIDAANSTGTASVLGGIAGVFVENTGGGSVDVAVDNVSGTTGNGIYLSQNAPGTFIRVSATGDVTSDGRDGIGIVNGGSGYVNVISTNAAYSTTVSGNDDGIDIENNNGGEIFVLANNVTGTTGFGITASNDALGTDLSITTTGAVSGGVDGMYANNVGTGDLTISAFNPDGTATTTGGSFGIVAANYNGGAVTVTADNVTGTTQSGIVAFNSAVGSTLSVTTYGDIQGNINGIAATNLGAGDLTITVSGGVTGDNAYGIQSTTNPGGMSIITLNDGANVTGGVNAIFNNAGDSMSTFNDGSTVSMGVELNDGSDDLTIAGADIVGVTVLDGGDDDSAADGFVDVLTFGGFNGSFSADLLNWEEVVFDASDASFTGAAISTPTVALQNGATLGVTQPGFMLTTELTIDGTSGFNGGTPGAGNVMINGNVASDGTLGTVDDAAGDTLTVNGNLTGTGDLAVDADISTGTADRISIAGNANGPGGISVNGFGTTLMPAEIPLVDVAGATAANAFSLSSGNFVLPGGEDVQVIGAFAYRLDFDAPAQEFFITPFDAGGALIFNPFASVIEAYPAQLTLLNTPGSTFQTWANRPSVGQGAVTQALFDFDPSPDNAIWFSLAGSQAEYQGQSTLNTGVETNVTGFEMGVDFPVFVGETGRLVAGASFQIQEADTDITAPIATAGINTNASSLTLSAIWLADSRFYASGQMRYSSFSSDMFLSGVGPVALGTQGEGWAASIEIGRAYAVSDLLTLVPQFQLTHSDVKGDGIADPFGSGLAGTITDGETTAARIGLHAERVTGRGSLFGSISYIHAFDADTTVSFAGFPFTTSLDENRVELRAGGQMGIGENSILYGGLTAQGGLSDFGDDNSVGVTGGIRVNF